MKSFSIFVIAQIYSQQFFNRPNERPKTMYEIKDLDSFNQLNHDEKAQYTWDHGRFISASVIDAHIINLYRLVNFFVEIKCDTDSYRVQEVKAFAKHHESIVAQHS